MTHNITSNSNPFSGLQNLYASMHPTTQKVSIKAIAMIASLSAFFLSPFGLVLSLPLGIGVFFLANKVIKKILQPSSSLPHSLRGGGDNSLIPPSFIRQLVENERQRLHNQQRERETRATVGENHLSSPPPSTNLRLPPSSTVSEETARATVGEGHNPRAPVGNRRRG